MKANANQVVSTKGAVLEIDRFEKVKDEYYALGGWDGQTGLQGPGRAGGARLERHGALDGSEGAIGT